MYGVCASSTSVAFPSSTPTGLVVVVIDLNIALHSHFTLELFYLGTVLLPCARIQAIIEKLRLINPWGPPWRIHNPAKQSHGFLCIHC